MMNTIPEPSRLVQCPIGINDAIVPFNEDESDSFSASGKTLGLLDLFS